MPKYLLLSSHFLPNDGGIARLMTELYHCFDKDKADFSVVLLEDKKVVPQEKIHQISKPRLLREWAAFLKVRRHKHTIISALWYPDGLIASFSKAKNKVVLVHGTELLPNPSPIKEFFLGRMRRRVLEKADLIVANSQFTADLVKEKFDIKSVQIIHPGVDIQRFSPASKQKAKQIFKVENKFVLSTLSVIRRHKGLETIFAALAKIPIEIRENITLLVGGKGEATDYYQALCQQKGISDNVKWLGFVAEKDLPDFYRASDLFLLTSVSDNALEGFGMVLIEAQACETPVIGTKSGGIIDAVEEGNGGFLIEEKDSEKLEELIVHLYQSPKELEIVEKAARLRVEENFTWEDYYLKLMSKLN